MNCDPWFCCHYAYSIPQFADFRVQAKDMADAERKIVRAFKAGRFDHVECVPYENVEDHRVSVDHPADPGDEYMPTMTQLCRKPRSRKS